MTKPKVEVDQKTYYRDIFFLYEILNSLKNVDEVKLFVKDILTKSELRMLKRRWHIARLLTKGLDIRAVAQQSKTSTQTVSKIKKILEEGHGGLLLAIERTRAKQINERRHARVGLRSSKYVRGWFQR